jgi:competence protein ComFB
MGLKEMFHFDDLSNIAEDLVITELENQLSHKNLMQAINEEHVLDMAAYALNLIRPMYRANLLGRVYATAFKEEYAEEICLAVTQAIDKVLRLNANKK